VIVRWIHGEQRRDLQSNAINPFASFGGLLHGLAMPITKPQLV
jgi:hypothetical protein